MSMFRSARTQIAHNATFGSLAGNKDLKPLQDTINAEKSLIQALQQLIVDCERAAEALKAWGAGEGEDLSDTLTASHTLLFQFCSAIQQVVQHEESVRGHLKAIRSKEEALDELRKQRRATAAKEDSADRKLAKMGPEHKNLAAQTQLLTTLRQEIRTLDSQIMTDEAALADFKRSTTKTFMSLKFGGIQEFSEKGALVGNYGKMVIQNIPLDTTQPGLPRAFYGGHENTKAIIADAQGSLSRVSFSTTPSATTGINTAPNYPVRQDSMAPSFAESVNTAEQLPPHIPDLAPSLAPLDRGPSLNMGHFMAANNNEQLTSPTLDTREFGAMPPPDPNQGSSHFRAPAMHDSPSTEGPHSPTQQKTAAATLGSRIAGGFKAGAGRFATFPVKARQRTGSTVSAGTSNTQGTEPVHSLEPSNITTASGTSYSPTAYDMPTASPYQSTAYTPTAYEAHQGINVNTNAPYPPTAYKPESPLPPVPQEQIASGGVHEPQVHSPQPQRGYPTHTLDDRPPSLDANPLGGTTESFSTSIAAALSHGFNSDDDAPKPGTNAGAPTTLPPASQGPVGPGMPPDANRDPQPPSYTHNQDGAIMSSPPPIGDRKVDGFAAPPGSPPALGRYAPPPGPPPHLAAQYGANGPSSPPSAPHIALNGSHPSQGGYPPGGAPPTLPPMSFSAQQAPGGWNTSEHVPTPPPASSIAATLPTQGLPHPLMPALTERPTTESVLEQQESRAAVKRKPAPAEEEDSELSYMSPPPVHAQIPSEDTMDDHADRKDRHVRFGAVSDVDEEIEKREGSNVAPSSEDTSARKRQTTFSPRLSAGSIDDYDSPLPSPFEIVTIPPKTGMLPAPQPQNRVVTPEMDEKSLNAAAAREVGRELDALNFYPPAEPQASTARTPSPLLPPAPAFAGDRTVSPHPAPGGPTSPPPAPPATLHPGPNSEPPSSPPAASHNGIPPPYASPQQSPTGMGSVLPPPSISLPRPGMSPNPSLASYHTPPEEFTPTQAPMSLPTIRNTNSSSSLTGGGTSPASPTGSGRINAGAFRRVQNRNASGAEGSPRLGLADTSPLAIGKRSLPASPNPQRPALSAGEGPDVPSQPPPSAPLNVPSVNLRNPSDASQGARPKSTVSAGSDFEDDYITSYMSGSPGDERRASAGYGAGKFATNLERGNDSGLR